MQAADMIFVGTFKGELYRDSVASKRPYPDTVRCIKRNQEAQRGVQYPKPHARVLSF
jgi:hypothetical protein